MHIDVCRIRRQHPLMPCQQSVNDRGVRLCPSDKQKYLSRFPVQPAGFQYQFLCVSCISVISVSRSLFKIRFLAVWGAGIVDWLQVLLVTGLTIIASLNIIAHEYEDNLRTRQLLFFLIAMVVWSFGLFFFYEQSSEEFLEMACVPVSILFAHFFTVKRGRSVFGLFHLSIVLFVALFVVRIWSFL